MAESPRRENEEPLLSHTELGAKDATTTIVLIHGAFSSSADWDLVTPSLQDSYHLLIPTLPGHGNSRTAFPSFSAQLSADLIAALIRAKARRGKAHIIGLSLGMTVALTLAARHTDVVNNIFVSGFKCYQMAPERMAQGLWLNNRIDSAIPRPLVRWLMDGADIYRTPNSHCTRELCTSIAQHLCINSDDEWPGPWPQKTLIVVAGKAGILPTADHPEAAKRLKDIAMKVERQGEVRLVTHPDMRHPWNRQAPELFAKASKAWLEEGRVVEGFVELDAAVTDHR